MAPLKPAKKDETGKRIQAVLDFAKQALKLLQDRRDLTTTFQEELDMIVKRSFPLTQSPALASSLSAFDTLGCELWNAATNIIREAENQRDPRVKRSDNARTVVLLRVFAFQLIDTAHHGFSRRSKDLNQRVRTFKIALKASRFCLDKGELEPALKVLEKCSENVSAVEEESPLVQISERNEENDNKTMLKDLVAEFYLLRITHAWKSERLDLAEHFFNKVGAARLADSARLAEKAADLFYEAGTTLARKQLVQPAMQWLERALGALDACDVDRLSQNAAELRLTITSTLVEALLSAPTASNIDRATNLVEQLYTIHGFSNRIVVQMMRLNLLLSRQPIEVDSLKEVLSQMLHSAVMTEHTFRTILRAIHRVRRVNSEVACRAIEELITARLLPDLPSEHQSQSNVQTWIEKSCITYALFATTSASTASHGVLNGLQRLFNEIVQHSDYGFSPKATHAAQTLIWKASSNGETDLAERWSQLLRHNIFQNAGLINKARIGRKVMTMAITKGDFDSAREAFYQMPNTAQDESASRYLAFKLGLRSEDYELAFGSLQAVMKCADRDPTFLYACVLDAQQSGMRTIAVAALQAILDKQPARIHLPSLLRCTARLLVGELDAKETVDDEAMEKLVCVFENAAGSTQAMKGGNEEQWRSEIQWWSKNAYNLALRFCGYIHPQHLVRLLGVCNKFIECDPDDAGPMHQDSLKARKALSHFLSATALIVLGRSADGGSEYSLQCYLHARREIEAFKAMQVDTGDSEEPQERKRRLFELLKFDLECIFKLQQWDQLDAALQACLNLEDHDRWDTLADIVLIIHKQTGAIGLHESASGHMVELLQRIINETWQIDRDIVKASQWLRLSFTVDLSEGSGEFALKLLQQAAGMAKKASGGDKDKMFPETELQWLSITAFNKAVDLLASDIAETAKVWIDAALDLARYADDNGALHANLTSKRELAMTRINAVAE